MLTAAQPAPPAPDGQETLVNGPNRFVLADPASGSNSAGFANAVSMTMYPASVHTVYDQTGTTVRGFVAPGVGLVPRSAFKDAETVAADPRVRSAASQKVAACRSSSSCDDITKAAGAAGAEAKVGEPVGVGRSA